LTEEDLNDWSRRAESHFVGELHARISTLHREPRAPALELAGCP
jgi:hypothetical protein